MADQAVSEREQKVLGPDRERAQPPARKFRDAQITMAHGAGGKATQTLIEGLFVPAFGRRDAGRDGRRRRGRRGRAGARVHHRLLRRQAAAVPRRVDRRAGGQRHGQRPGRLRRAAARAHALAGPRGGPARRRAAGRGRGHRRGGAATAGVEIVAGDTKVVERGHADGMYVCTTGIGRRDPRAPLSPAARPARATAMLLSGPIGEHGTAIMLARGEFDLDAEIESDTRLAVAGGRRAARGGRRRAALHARRHPRRRGVGAERAGPRVGRGDGGAASGPCRCCRRSRARPRSSGSTRCTSRTRASWWRSSPPRPRTAALQALRAVPGCERAAEIGEVRTEPPGMVLVETSFGGRAGHGPAGRRPAATDLLRRKERRWRARRTRSTGRRRRSPPTSSG